MYHRLLGSYESFSGSELAHAIWRSEYPKAGFCKGCYVNLRDPANRALIDDAAVSTMPLWAASKVMPNGKTRWMQAEIQ
jgi:hypothetical protein